jgi:acyl-CoA thioesterase FadM
VKIVGRRGVYCIPFSYELLSGDSEQLHATGFSAHLWLDRETRKPVRADEDVMKAFAPFVSEP